MVQHKIQIMIQINKKKIIKKNQSVKENKIRKNY
jgi:hypothetical protein